MAKKKKTTAKLLQELQLVFNKWVRLRDAERECISCGRPMPVGCASNASHLFPVKGHSTLRFNEDNVHKSCIWCNCALEGNTVEYLQRLPMRIGKERVDTLLLMAEQDRKVNYKWQRWELEEMIQEYKQKVKDYENS